MEEVQVKNKIPLGRGVEHTVFNFEKLKDKVIKTKTNNIVYDPDKKKLVPSKFGGSPLNQNEIKIFINNPELFAKVFKVTERYAVLEKLDTNSFKNDLEKISKSMIRFFIADPEMAKNFTLKTPENLTAQDFDGAAQVWVNRNDRDFIKGLIKYSVDKNFTIKFLKFINNVSELSRKSGLGRGIDVHENNIGYDKEKNFKLLDI